MSSPERRTTGYLGWFAAPLVLAGMFYPLIWPTPAACRPVSLRGLVRFSVRSERRLGSFSGSSPLPSTTWLSEWRPWRFLSPAGRSLHRRPSLPGQHRAVVSRNHDLAEQRRQAGRSHSEIVRRLLARSHFRRRLKPYERPLLVPIVVWGRSGARVRSGRLGPFVFRLHAPCPSRVPLARAGR